MARRRPDHGRALARAQALRRTGHTMRQIVSILSDEGTPYSRSWVHKYTAAK